MSEPAGHRIAALIAGWRRLELPGEALDAARQSLLDWFGCCLGALEEPAAAAVRQVAAGWGGGGAPLVGGGTAPPAAAALVNGTLAHCLYYDDTHIDSILHGSGPTWAAVLALATARQQTLGEALVAYAVGFEIGARVGRNGIGERLNGSGWHATGVLGRLSATAAAAALLDLDAGRAGNAIGLAATQAGGLTVSIGSMAKPFHVGRAAMDGVLSAELAAAGMTAAADALDRPDGLLATLFQEPGALPELGAFGRPWELTRTSYKPYPACQLTHAAIDAGRALAPRLRPEEIGLVRAQVHPLTLKLAGRTQPRTAAEGKFSLSYCLALALAGIDPAGGDAFAPQRLEDRRIAGLADRVEAVADPAMTRTSAHVEVRLRDGRVLAESVPLCLGNPGNPMFWSDLERKFLGLAEPALGTAGARELLHLLRHAGADARLDAAFDLCDRRGGRSAA